MKVFILYDLDRDSDGSSELRLYGTLTSEDRARRAAEMLGCEMTACALNDLPFPAIGELWWWSVEFSLVDNTITSPQVLPKCGKILSYSSTIVDKRNTRQLRKALTEGGSTVSLYLWSTGVGLLAMALDRYREQLLELGLHIRPTPAEAQKAVRQRSAVECIREKIGLLGRGVWFTETSPVQGAVRYVRPKDWQGMAGRGTVEMQFVHVIQFVRPYQVISIIGYDETIPEEDLVGAVCVC
jgi:hypothetical protein